MMTQLTNWTTELRYQPYQSWSPEYIKNLLSKVQQSDWRLAYHIQPQSGLLNDPNGFSYFNNQWHLFYQAFPYGPVHGIKSWVHMISDDLVHWNYQGIPLLPDSQNDSHGVYSGSALPIDDKLFLMYTGNIRNHEWERKALQLGAWMNQENQVTKIETPLILTDTERYTQNFRDPQLFSYEDSYLAIIGAQDTELQGKIAVFESTNLTDWQWLGNLTYTDLPMGFMVECPNLVFIENQPVLLFCPQGLATSDLSYQNIYPNTYILGSSFTKKTLTIEDATTLRNLDEGFDVYATQAFNAPDGRALCVSWIGLPEIDYPTYEEGWLHCLSLVKELTIKDGELYQYPVQELKKLRTNQRSFSGKLAKNEQELISNTSFTYEAELKLPKNEIGELKLFADSLINQYLRLYFDTVSGKLTVDRSKSGVPFAEEFGVTREIDLPSHTELTLTIFVDHSVCEIFINHGFKVITLRLFPDETQTSLLISGINSGEYRGEIWELNRSLTP
ncbi:sucrose-6-phosphate hydrolase [Carnobacterium gallinarum]|uniref:sucrose-6-phosphate hydrolase n=1 Tax=Carnobacterium gallinarum TaxID=2749 RepID=UPI000557D308|nr:sucrose-6-phosphate hydrolase [Carnobacterium gallinarum]